MTEVEFRITDGPHWNKPLAFASAYPFTHFQINHQTKEYVQRQNLMLHFFGNDIDTFYLQSTIGLKRDKEIKSEKIYLYKYNHAYFPDNTYYNSDPLPIEWLELFESREYFKKEFAKQDKELAAGLSSKLGFTPFCSKKELNYLEPDFKGRWNVRQEAIISGLNSESCKQIIEECTDRLYPKYQKVSQRDSVAISQRSLGSSQRQSSRRLIQLQKAELNQDILEDQNENEENNQKKGNAINKMQNQEEKFDSNKDVKSLTNEELKNKFKEFEKQFTQKDKQYFTQDSRNNEQEFSDQHHEIIAKSQPRNDFQIKTLFYNSNSTANLMNLKQFSSHGQKKKARKTRKVKSSQKTHSTMQHPSDIYNATMQQKELQKLQKFYGKNMVGSFSSVNLHTSKGDRPKSAIQSNFNSVRSNQHIRKGSTEGPDYFKENPDQQDVIKEEKDDEDILQSPNVLQKQQIQRPLSHYIVKSSSDVQVPLPIVVRPQSKYTGKDITARDQDQQEDDQTNGQKSISGFGGMIENQSRPASGFYLGSRISKVGGNSAMSFGSLLGNQQSLKQLFQGFDSKPPSGLDQLMKSKTNNKKSKRKQVKLNKKLQKEQNYEIESKIAQINNEQNQFKIISAKGGIPVLLSNPNSKDSQPQYAILTPISLSSLQLDQKSFQ